MPSPARPLEAASGTERQPLRLLLIEDSEVDAELIVREVSRGGYLVEWARVDSAAGLAAALRQPWDAIACDWVMPGFGAPEALRMIADAGIDVPTIIVSGEVGEEYAVTAMKSGAHDFVSKHRLARLVPALERECRDAAGRRARQRAEAALRATEEGFRRLIESSLDIVAILEPDGTYRYVSPAVELLTGFAPADLVGTNALDLVHPDDRVVVAERLAEGLARGDDSGAAEYRHRHKAGGWRVLEAVARNLRDDPVIAGIVIHVRDMTTRREVETALQRSEERMRLALGAAPMGTWEYDVASGLVQWAGALATRMGHLPGASPLPVEVFRTFLHPEDRERVRGLVDAALRDDVPFHYEARLLGPDGATRWVLVHGRVLRDGGGRPQRLVGVDLDVTERKEAEEGLRQQLALQQQLETIAAVSPDAIYTAHLRADGSMCFPYASSALMAISGLPPEAIREDGRAIFALVHPDDLARINATTAESVRTLQPWRCEFRLCNPQRGERWVAGHSIPRRQADGTVVWHGVMRDVTDARRAEDALRASEARHRSLFHNMLNGFALCRMEFVDGRPHDFVYLEVNEAFATLTGLRDVVGRRVSEVIPGIRETNPEVFEIYGRVVTSGRSERFESFLPALGCWLDVAVYATGDGCFAAVFENVTERREGERLLRASEARLRVTMDSMLEGLQVIGEDWRYRYINPAAAAQGRRAPGELLGRTMMECYPGIERSALFAVLQRCMAAHAPQRLLNEFTFPDGRTGWFDLSIQRIPEGLAVLSVDVTDRQRAEAELRQLTADLEARVTARTAELDAANRDLQAFTYSVSHDLRAPLRTIDGFSLAVLEDYAALLPAEGQRHLEAIRRGARRMGQIIDALLQLSRVGRVRLETGEVDTAALVREVVDELAGLYPGRHVAVELGPLPACRGDRTLLRQVWANLLDNAYKYTARREAARIEVAAHAAPEGPVYVVRDNGAGFDMAQASRLFGVFQRLHRDAEFEGTGIGLAIVQQIVQRHGGRVWADAAVDRGATFCFTLGHGGDAAATV